jgi:ubiquinone/menaquinone biosynthesis C-methylase UbiE
LDTSNFAHPVRNVGALGIQPGMVVADFGSGSGAYVLAIGALLAHDGRVYAVDVQKDLLRRTHNEAKKRGLNSVHILWGDLEHPHGSKLADQSCDLVLISNLLFQVENKSAVLREARRILRPRGRLAIVDWEDSFGGMGPIPEQVVSKDSAIELCEHAGFRFQDEFAAGAHHYGLILRGIRDSDHV